jgi:hypothetical protein
MARPKGQPKLGGRVKGTPNKATADIKNMLLEALEQVGNKEYFVRQSVDNPVAFMGLIGKIIPKEVQATIEGDMRITNVVYTIVDSDETGQKDS